MNFSKSIAILLSLVIAVLLTACGQKSSFNSATADPQKIADQIKAGTKFTDQLSAVSSSAAVKRYGLDEAALKASAGYVGTGSTAEEIAVLEASDKAAAAEMLKKVQSFISTQKDSYADYKPSEVPKLKDAVVQQKDNFVVMCVSADSSKARSLISSLLR